VKKNVYGIKVKLRTWRIVISLKFNYVFVSLQSMDSNIKDSNIRDKNKKKMP